MQKWSLTATEATRWLSPDAPAWTCYCVEWWRCRPCPVTTSPRPRATLGPCRNISRALKSSHRAHRHLLIFRQTGGNVEGPLPCMDISIVILQLSEQWLGQSLRQRRAGNTRPILMMKMLILGSYVIFICTDTRVSNRCLQIIFFVYGAIDSTISSANCSTPPPPPPPQKKKKTKQNSCIGRANQ